LLLIIKDENLTEEEKTLPMVFVALDRRKGDNNMIYLKSFNFLLQALEVNVEESFIVRLNPFISDVMNFVSKLTPGSAGVIDRMTLSSLKKHPLISLTNNIILRSYESPLPEPVLQEKKTSSSRALSKTGSLQDTTKTQPLLRGNEKKDESSESSLIKLSSAPVSLSASQQKSKEKKVTKLENFLKTYIYIENLFLQPIKINLSVAIQDIRSISVLGTNNEFLRIVSQFLTIDEATLMIDPLLKQQVLTELEQFTYSIRKYYVDEIIVEVLKLSRTILYFVGDPFGTVANMGKGVKNAFYDPSKGNISSPGDFARSVLMGTSKIFRNFVGSVFGSLGKITGSFSTALAQFALDDDYLKEKHRQFTKKEQPKNFVTGFGMAGFALVFF
jgi:uncharacterized membrane protein